MKFQLQSKFKPTGDQPAAIDQLVKGLIKNYRDQTLLGVTGSGKTFTMANIIAQVQKPTLIISHNKTLAAQLASEFRDFFPKNEVHYFVSYYDYYQPEAYLPTTDTYIEKETEINEEIDRLRHASTQSLISRKDVIIVASVSCIYGLGAPEEYQKEGVFISVGTKVNRKRLLENLVKIQYQRNNHYLDRGTFRIKGGVIEIFPIYSEQNAYQIQMWGDEIDQIKEIDSLTGEVVQNLKEVMIFPATHYLVPFDKQELAFKNIRADLKEQVALFGKQNKLIEAQRIEQRTRYDLEMIKETGYCNGIENYSRYFDGRKLGQPPYTLLDYFPKDFMMFIDESHMTIPQIRGMYKGDRARKNTLVEYGFRLPAARDNRPLTFSEFDQKINQVVYASATPMEYEKRKSKQIAEQLIRPTGLLDPTIELKPAQHQIDDLLDNIRQRVKRHQRVLVTVLTKRMAEELSEYLKEVGIAVHYLHSEIDTFERLEILRDLRLGTYDVVVGINLLREGLDLPEVSLIAILDADKEGYLRSETALIQTMGRAARHQEGHIIMYADKITDSMKRAMAETKRRRKYQEEYNKKHQITPQSIKKAIKEERLAGAKLAEKEVSKLDLKAVPQDEIAHLIKDLKNQMELAAKNLEFEKATILRDQISALKKEQSKSNRKK
ncbi:MAG: excinuclease ABC subunit B [Candidatus Kerfeldbacteria bacterium CG08_land_8_20_14_0_20_40_16]|uniref:UvrABC system protein B n=1 Tax=Candidatus Kerfeldbacteria bacterium CG08_land_8_20_14_0_20_40_16 TaxID=2014244 RepID=A0A2H0YX78_9BACT|nr:MAG: excinuclease ABC subunit B [Candidatus Kerfeldbacteria bacterium CG08_land_8_20_14_0_20_40_16]